MSDRINQIQENPFKSLIVLAIPVIILLIFNESYVILDTQFLAKLGDTVIIAFGYIGHIYYFVNRSGKGIGRGVSSMIARLMGAKDFESINNIVIHGILLIAAYAILFQITFVFFSTNILSTFVPDEQIPAVMIYLQCLFFFLFFICLSEYLVEMLNGEGDTRLSATIMVIGVFLNIALDYILIFPCGLGVLGASLGTCLSYVITTIIFLYIYLIRKDHIVKIRPSDFNLNLGIFREILINAIPIILDSLVVTVSGLAIMNALGTFAPPITAVAFILILRVQMFLFTPIQGLSKSCNIVVGHLFGAKRFKDTKKQINNSILISFLINTVIIILLISCFNVIIPFFTHEAAVMAEVENIIAVVVIDLVLLAVILNCNQALVAIGRSTISFISVFVKCSSFFLYILLLCYFLGFGKFGVLLSIVFSDITQSAFSYFIFMYYVSKEQKKYSGEIAENASS